jgi:NADPH:quinone reductase-like Zn-dependent oxidoreductase
VTAERRAQRWAACGRRRSARLRTPPRALARCARPELVRAASRPTVTIAPGASSLRCHRLVIGSAKGMFVRILITGGTGVIGRQLIPLLAAGGHKTYAFTRSGSAAATAEALGAVPGRRRGGRGGELGAEEAET